MKYPIGIQDFRQLREGGYVYVDKTRNIYAFEFKLDKTAKAALQQIYDRGYPERLMPIPRRSASL